MRIGAAITALRSSVRPVEPAAPATAGGWPSSVGSGSPRRNAAATSRTPIARMKPGHRKLPL